MGNVKWSKVNQNDLLELYSKNLSLKEICLKLNITEHIVNKILKLNGLRGGTKIDRLKDKYQDIIKRYQEVNKLSIVAKEFNVTESLVNKILKQHDVPKRDVVKELNTNEVIDFYEKTHRVKLVAEKFGVSNSTILKLLHKNNIRVSIIKYTDEEIIDYYHKVKTIRKVCDDLKISDIKVSNVLKSNNIELLTLRRKEFGDVYGKLTIIGEDESKITSGGKKKRQFILRCECGVLVKRSSHSLDKGKTWHCGCVTIENKRKKEDEKRIRKDESLRKRIEREEMKRNQPKPIKQSLKKYFVGSVKDKLTILSEEGKGINKVFLCKCECGNIKEIKINNFYTTKSCGCLQREESTKHGLSPKRDNYQRKWYDRWRSMISRCYNPKIKPYKNYGGRGITVCGRWMEPNGIGCKNYIEDIHNILGPQPSPEHSLDRINNDGPYEINNLRWATNSEQSKNRRRNLKK